MQILEQKTAAAACMSPDKGVAAFLTAYLQFWLSISEANEAIGHPFDRVAMKALILTLWPNREIGPMEQRALATAVAYRENIRLSDSGTKDSRVAAAMMAAARLEGLKGADPVEAIKKSIQRFRKSLRGKRLYSLDPETLVVSLINADQALIPGLPGKAGRPKKKPSRN